VDTERSRNEKLESVQLATPNGATAELFLHGAHLSSWRPQGGSERLFISKKARFEPGTAIRGGVPIIFPQFAGRGQIVKHGFGRILPWQLLSNAQLDATTAQAVLSLSSSDETRAYWPHNFAASYTVTLRDHQLDMQLQITNTGAKACSFTAALHTYLRVGDISQTQLHGLHNCQYEDDNGDLQREPREMLSFDSAIDRVYHNTASPLTVSSPAQRVDIRARGFDDTVVWNPWLEGSKAIGDMADDDYRDMLCVEAAAVIKPIILNSNESWTASQTLYDHSGE
jgi:glucose-6-phosphate 1-epimerase